MSTGSWTVTERLAGKGGQDYVNATADFIRNVFGIRSERPRV